MTSDQTQMTSDRVAMLLAAAVVVAAAALYHFHGVTGVGYEATLATNSVFVWLSRRWVHDGVYGNDFPCGWAAPLVSLWMVWRLRAELRAEPKSASWAGFAMVLFSLLLLWLGARAQQPRISAASLLMLVWAIPFHLYGRAVARRLILPAAFLLFTMPFDLLGGVVLKLRALAASISAALLSGFGVPMTMADATTIRCDLAPQFVIELSKQAGGLRSLMLVMAAAAILAWLRQRGLLRQAVLVAVSPLVVLSASVVRTMFHGFVELMHAMTWIGAGATNAVVSSSGLVFYSVAAVLLWLTHRGLQRNWRAMPGGGEA